MYERGQFHQEVHAALHASRDLMHSVQLSDALQAELKTSTETFITHVLEDAHNVARHLQTDVSSRHIKLAARINAALTPRNVAS